MPRRRMCPTCGMVVSGPCPRCSRARKAPARSRKDARREGERREAAPWRRRYRSKEFKRASQVALSRTQGRCAATGERIADWRGGRWVMRRGKGAVHHIVPLSRGGTDSPDNLVPLCTRVHNKVEAELRRRCE